MAEFQDYRAAPDNQLPAFDVTVSGSLGPVLAITQ